MEIAGPHLLGDPVLYLRSPGLHTRLPGLQIDLPGARCTYSLGLNHRIANRILDPGGDFILGLKEYPRGRNPKNSRIEGNGY